MGVQNLYVEREGKWEGPFAREHLQTFLEKGLVLPDTPCREEGVAELRTVEFFTKPAVRAPKQSPLAARILIGVGSVLMAAAAVSFIALFFFDDADAAALLYGSGSLATAGFMAIVLGQLHAIRSAVER